jgi:hypothetical protein
MIKTFLPALLCACCCTAALAQATGSDKEQTVPPPQNRHQADERERQGSFPRLPPSPERAETGAINPANGQYYPPAGNGDVINPATGERYLGIPGGYVNPNTGELMPRIR